MDVAYETIHDDPKANAVVMQFLALRTLNDEDKQQLKRVFQEYYLSLDSFRRNKKEVYELLWKNAGVIFTEDYKTVLSKAEELQQRGSSPRGANKRIIKSANRIKGRIRFFYYLLKRTLYEDIPESSRESSQDTDHVIQVEEQTVSMAAYERQRETYEMHIQERDEMIQTLQQEIVQLSQRPVDEIDIALLDLSLEDDPVLHRDDELYETPPKVVEPLMHVLCEHTTRVILDPCSGNGMMSNYLVSQGYNVTRRDLFHMETHHDFLTDPIPENVGFIICHPPLQREELFLQRCYELKKTFALLVSQDALKNVHVQELLYKEGGNLHFLVGPQSFIYENEEKVMGHYVWVVGNNNSEYNRFHMIGHDWSQGHGIRVSSFDETIEINEDKNEQEKEKNEQEKKKVVDEDDELICSICWDTLEDETIQFGENCAHPFCKSCWDDYHKSTRHNRSCPVCRTLLKAKRGRGRPSKK
jgi:hypothetical protein